MAGTSVADPTAALAPGEARVSRKGLAQKQIPMGARFVALACRYDDLTTGGRDGEPEAVDAEVALSRLGEQCGSALDPGLLVLAAPALARFSVDGQSRRPPWGVAHRERPTGDNSNTEYRTSVVLAVHRFE